LGSTLQATIKNEVEFVVQVVGNTISMVNILAGFTATASTSTFTTNGFYSAILSSPIKGWVIIFPIPNPVVNTYSYLVIIQRVLNLTQPNSNTAINISKPANLSSSNDMFFVAANSTAVA